MSGTLPQVSVVTPSLNQAQFIQQVIESVLRQDYSDLDYIVIDGGSTDGTIEILKSYGDRLRWISEPDSGQSNAINKGFRMARGEIVAWINSDDVMLAGAVRTAAEAFARDPDLGMVYGEGYIIDEDGFVKRRFPETRPFDLWRLVHIGDTILQQTVFMRKSVLDEVGYLDEALHWGMDWDLFIRISKRFRVQYLNYYMGCIREYQATKTATGGVRRFRELQRIIRRHAGRRLVPAFFGYGMDTWHTALERRPPSRLRTALERLEARACRTVWPYMETRQGWYPGGWAGPVVQFWFPNLGRPVYVEAAGALPPTAPGAPALQIAMVVNGRRVTEQKMQPGPFRMLGPIPASKPNGEAVKVDLIADGPARWKKYAEWRQALKVYYLLHRVELQAPETARLNAA